jgi:hypothetical protein
MSTSITADLIVINTSRQGLLALLGGEITSEEPTELKTESTGWWGVSKHFSASQIGSRQSVQCDLSTGASHS